MGLLNNSLTSTTNFCFIFTLAGDSGWSSLSAEDLPAFSYQFYVSDGSTQIPIPHAIDSSVINQDTKETRLLDLGKYTKLAPAVS